MKEHQNKYPHINHYQEMVQAVVDNGGLGPFDPKLTPPIEAYGMFWGGRKQRLEGGAIGSLERMLAENYCEVNPKVFTLEKIPLGKELDALHTRLVREGQYRSHVTWTRTADHFCRYFAEIIAARGGAVYAAVDGASFNSTFRRLEMLTLLQSNVSDVIRVRQGKTGDFLTECMPIGVWYYDQRWQWMNYWLQKAYDGKNNMQPFMNAAFEVEHANSQIEKNILGIPQWNKAEERKLFEYGNAMLGQFDWAGFCGEVSF